MHSGQSNITTSTLRDSSHRVVIAVGSNLGDRFHNIELALRLLEAPKEVFSHQNLEESGPDVFVTVLDTSFLYETAPMYFTDQPSFINCALLAETNIPPVLLLVLLKRIESAVGRVPSMRYGPRAVDLDIIFYGDLVIDTRPVSEQITPSDLEGHLVVPHPRVAEREFVLRPLNDMIPDYIHPVLEKSICKLLGDLPEGDQTMHKVIPFPRYPLALDHPWPYPAVSVVPRTLTYWIYPIIGKRPRPELRHKTHIMATLNTTPDSFSDGATHNSPTTALEYARESVEGGASIIDVGGYSTKPGAAFVATGEEINRTVPIIEAIRTPDPNSSHSDVGARLREIPISIDTFRWEVARTSILAGANCINDVCAFTGRDLYPPVDETANKRAQDSMTAMKQVAREFAVPVILMHSRGDAGQNKDYSMYLNGTDRGATIRGVQTELGDKIERIVGGGGGVRRWMVIVDPGIGFSKTMEGNLELLRGAANIVADVKSGPVSRWNPLRGYPQLIGPSRKSFLGAILSQGEQGRDTTPKERIWATATAVACAVQQGAMIVRVHDTKEMADVVHVADTLWR